MTDEQTQLDTTPILKHVNLAGTEKMSATINLMEPHVCEKCNRTYYMGNTGQGWVKVVEERPGSYERHVFLCQTKKEIINL